MEDIQKILVFRKRLDIFPLSFKNVNKETHNKQEFN